jgi:membrane protein required for colicin V production
MIIDIVFVILLALAIIRGISRGFIVAIFSFIAIIIGVAAAMKLSFIVTGWLEEFFHTGKQWLPISVFSYSIYRRSSFDKMACQPDTGGH